MSNGFCKNRGYVVFYCYISSNSVLFLMFWTFVAFNTFYDKLIYVNVEYFTNFCIVSIHPMLKFINLPLLIWRQTANISIHPMLKFIKSDY